MLFYLLIIVLFSFNLVSRVTPRYLTSATHFNSVLSVFSFYAILFAFLLNLYLFYQGLFILIANHCIVCVLQYVSVGIFAIYKLKSRDSRTDSCGTPASTILSLDVSDPISTSKLLFCKYDMINWIHYSRRFILIILYVSPCCPVLSKAFSTSRNMVLDGVDSLTLFIIFSVTLINWRLVEWASINSNWWIGNRIPSSISCSSIVHCFFLLAYLLLREDWSDDSFLFLVLDYWIY